MTATCTLFICNKCKQNKTTYFQMQTRSSDEPMTTFVTCVVRNLLYIVLSLIQVELWAPLAVLKSMIIIKAVNVVKHGYRLA